MTIQIVTMAVGIVMVIVLVIAVIVEEVGKRKQESGVDQLRVLPAVIEQIKQLFILHNIELKYRDITVTHSPKANL